MWLLRRDGCGLWETNVRTKVTIVKEKGVANGEVGK